APASPTEVCERTRRDGGSVFPALANTGDPNGPRGLSANEITGALIPIMARSEMLQPKAGYIDARPLPPTRRNSLATHGRTIHWVISGNTHNEPMSSALPPESGHAADALACPLSASKSRRFTHFQ